MSKSLNNLIQEVLSSPLFALLKDSLAKSNITAANVYGSLLSLLTAYCYGNYSGKIFFISHENERLIKVRDDLEIISDKINTSLYSSGINDNDPVSKTLLDLTEEDEFVVFANAGEISRKIISKERFKGSLLELKKNSVYSFEELIKTLKKYNFSRKDFVEEEGDYSVRGGIIDLFAESMESPVRIEFFGDTIESLREFEINSQRSVREIESVKITINLSEESEENEIVKNESITSYLPEGTLIVFDEPEICLGMISDENDLRYLGKFRNIYVPAISGLSGDINSVYDKQGTETINFNSSPQPSFHSNLKSLYKNLSGYLDSGYSISILASDSYQSKRIKELIEDFEDESVQELDEQIHTETEFAEDFKSGNIKKELLNNFSVLPESIQSGFIFHDRKTVVYTEHQIFGRYFKHIKKRKQKFKGLTFSELKELQYGDYIVHRDFGIGIYSGLKIITVGNSRQEVVVLSYNGNDKLFLNLNNINLIKKYSGNEGHKPALTKLGGNEWDKLKERAKKKVKDIARDLIILYAKRKSEKGYTFSKDTHWQKELEANFMYEDTPDQFSATEDTKADMETETPMDRLICGDVGFGKTEIAVRAAFKAVMDNKQAAVLVPTTILAVQHYNTFRDRLSPFAVEVDNITRLRSAKEQKKILERLEEGKLNILIGTHRLLSKDIKFKDLGLLIIDEEQRFGVKAKEKLRSLRPNVDTLTLTATPIPRTLNFSLLGARDLSIINTPPKNRKPIITEIISLDWNNISTIIRNELKHNGQVYFVNDKIKNLHLLGDTIKTYVPEAKIGIAHGQMEGKELEDVIIRFIEKKLNVLLCTKIIESGLDIPNVNTIIINNADMYGLAELYQLRGRVGRSEVQAYAYLISPPNGNLKKTAIRRLQAIEEFTELGSGFNLAMRDMEIRGVGNLLGREQSGYVQEIGFDMFISIIEEAVLELKDNEFKDLFKNEDSLKKLNESIKKKTEEKSAVIENDLNALIQKDYIQNDTERLNIYRRLYELTNDEELLLITAELKDRFGEFLDDVNNLLRIIKIKIKCTELGLEKISIRGRSLKLHFPSDKEHKIFKSNFFEKLLETISGINSGKYSLGGDKDKLTVEIILDSIDDNERLNETENILSIKN